MTDPSPQTEARMDLLTLAVFLALGAVLWSLVSGISAMAVDGQVAHHSSCSPS
jgi:hypothetical protein